jgi:hypothetical protein
MKEIIAARSASGTRLARQRHLVFVPKKLGWNGRATWKLEIQMFETAQHQSALAI